MKKQQMEIADIPTVLWGPVSDKLFIAVHGDQSNKEDDVIQILAEEAVLKGYQVLSFDLPEHGARQMAPKQCTVQNCVEDLEKILAYARTVSDQISLFGCSIGAYFSMLAFRQEPLHQTLFLSPVVDMKRIIQNMMNWFGISEEQLEREQEIITPAKILSWDYYQYVLEHPVRWQKQTKLLYGKQDQLCEYDYVKHFAQQTSAEITVLETGGHFFHTEEQLATFRQWLRNNFTL